MRMSNLKNQSGQVVIILTLIMLVSLTVGLAVFQRSVSDVSTSTKTEQSSRAFSAAEAGIERAIQAGTPISSPLPISLDNNQSSATYYSSGELPVYTQALEYPAISKAEFAHFWLANPTDLTPYYTQPNITLYFGNVGSDPDNGLDLSDKPAIEVNLITRDASGNYLSSRSFFDPDTTRGSVAGSGASGFAAPTSCDPNGLIKINTSSSVDFVAKNAADDSYPAGANVDRAFYCKVTIPTKIFAASDTPMLLRVRLLYSRRKHRLALDPSISSCSTTIAETKCSLPPQATIYTSVGVSGDTQRRLQNFQIKNVAPQFLDFALFSNSNIQK